MGRLWCVALLLVGASISTCGAARLGDTTLLKQASRRRTQRGPIIGIVTQPGDLAEGGQSYFSAGYVKWLEAAGARVAPILYDMTRKELDDIFSVVSGIMWPGGNYPLTSDTRWFRTGQQLFDLAVASNRRGDPFPLHGTCLGLQLLCTIVSGDQNALQPVDAEDMPARLEFTPEAGASPFLGRIPDRVRANMADLNISMHNHHYGLTLDTYADFPKLGAFFNTLAHTTDRQGVKYASVLEAKDFPFTGLAFHPEKVPYEWTPSLHIPHTAEAVESSFQLAASLVATARNSSHGGRSVVEEDALLIYNWPTTFSGRHVHEDDNTAFEQVYIFDINQYRSEVQQRLAGASKGAAPLQKRDPEA